MPENQERKKPSIAVVGIGNKNGASILQQSVVADPLPNVTGGMNVFKEEGINGKGELKEYGANPMTADPNLVKASSQIGKAYVVAKKSTDAIRFVFKDSVNTDTSLHVVYDLRNTQEPLAIFKKTVVLNDETNKKELITEKLTDKQIEIVPKGTFSKSDLGKIVMGLVSTLNKKTIDTDSRSKILASLKEKNLLAPKKLSEVFDFIKVYDQNLSKTEDNIKALKMALVVDADVAVPKGGLEKLSEVYNPLTLDGFVVKSYRSAADIKRLINGEIKEEALGTVEKAFLEYNQTAGMTAIELVEAEKTFGVDANGNIVLAEESNVPYQSGGAIHQMAIANKIAEASQARQTIDGAFWAFANTIDPQKYPRNEGGKTYSEAEIAQAEKVLQTEAEKAAKVLGENAEKDLSEILSASDPIVTQMTSGDIKKMQNAQNLARDLMSVVRAGATKAVIQEDPLVLVKDGYFKEGRQLGQANASPKTQMPYDFKSGERMIHISADIPKLIKTVGDDEDAVVNFKTTKMTVLQLVVDQEGKVKDVMPVNTLGAWAKQQSLGRILKAISDIDANDPKLEAKFKNLINFGGKLNGEDTKFGLGAVVKDENNLVAQYFKQLVSEIRSIAYPDGNEKFDAEALKSVQDKIAGLIESDDYSTRNLGKQVIALQERSKNLEDYFFRAGMNTLKSRSDDKAEKREHLKDVLIRVLNGEEVEPTKGATLSIAKTGAVVKAFLDPVRNGVGESIVKIATAMAFKHDDFKKGSLINRTKDGKPYIQSSFYDENIFTKKELEEAKEKLAKADAKIDLDGAKALMEELQEYYNANKEVYVKNTSFYAEDEEIVEGAGIEMDEDLEALLKELSEESTESVTNEAPSQDADDMIAAAQEEAEIPEEAENVIVDMEEVTIDPSLFGDEIDVEEDPTQTQEDDAVKAAQAAVVEI